MAKKQKIVRILDERAGLPEGSGVYLEKESKTLYYGLWCSALGSYNVKVKKKFCKIERN